MADSPVHYRNLTRGLLCDCAIPESRVIRLQSTWCEQKRWNDILTHLGADLYYNLAIGRTCIVHDVSEKDRETRACWQGLAWVRFVTQQLWYGEAEPVFVRRGFNATDYFTEQLRCLDERTVRAVTYFRQFTGQERGTLNSCYQEAQSGVICLRNVA